MRITNYYKLTANDILQTQWQCNIREFGKYNGNVSKGAHQQ